MDSHYHINLQFILSVDPIFTPETLLQPDNLHQEPKTVICDILQLL